MEFISYYGLLSDISPFSLMVLGLTHGECASGSRLFITK